MHWKPRIVLIPTLSLLVVYRILSSRQPAICCSSAKVQCVCLKLRLVRCPGCSQQRHSKKEASLGGLQGARMSSVYIYIYIYIVCSIRYAYGFVAFWAPPQYPKRRLSVRSRKVSKPRDWYFKLSYRFEIWQAHRQQRCRSACQISERSDNSKYKSRGFETLRDLTERRLFGYWDGALCVYGCTIHSYWSRVIYTLWTSYHCPRDCEITLKDMGKIEQYRIKAKHRT